MHEEDQFTIGIDLGTTNSCVTFMDGNRPRVIPNRSGYSTTPSIVAFTNKGRRLVGQLAKRQAVVNSANTIYASKRLIGRRWDSPLRARIQEIVPYQLSGDMGGGIRIDIQDQHYSPEEIGSIVLAELKLVAEEYLGHSVTNAVITVPAYFNDAQRQATKDAGRMAGLEVLRIINEPTAAALCYGFGKQNNQKIAVYDLGGGTFDISILEINDGVFEVLSTAGDTFLGGEDFDQRVIEWLVFSFAKEHKIDLRKNKMALQRLKEASENARCELSSVTETEINLPFLITDNQGQTLHLRKVLTREKLETLTADLIDRTIQICQNTLEEAYISPEEIDEVLLIGGMSRMPKIQQAITQHFGHPPNRGIHPDEAVALGAAVQGAALLEERTDVLLLDVTPHSLGIMIAGGFYQILIEQNTTVPCSHSHIFTTVKDYQTQVKILVLQGESSRAEENELLGEFVLDGLRPAPRGEVQVEVTFSISADGIVSVSARDLETNQQQSILVTATSRLSEEEMRRIIEENRDFALEAKTSEEFERQRSVAEQDMQHILDLLPQVQEIVSNSSFGQEALGKAEEIILRTEQAIEEENLMVLASVLPALQRTRKIFRQILDHSLNSGRM
ncbi:MAG TPA: molecular chaperone DnaK [Myxococcales bacterium]|mgnify:CR=1 FL=1|nr:molecular chaperone DnaK [Deltaproteobacteria bacterium]HAA55929.1 molecular chaperone DnaK [Myxococcales bacterium]|tara:strand:- start:7950 stop:9800 length:1851 start_codon:yes stop_codon:yes gene_type:complete